MGMEGQCPETRLMVALWVGLNRYGGGYMHGFTRYLHRMVDKIPVVHSYSRH
jgi:hypothetical protein